jgi:hypothetical protein
MPGLGVKSSRPHAKHVWLAAICLPLFALLGTLRGEHGFNKGEWPFRPLERQSPPTAAASEWALNPIDRFIIQELAKKGLALNEPADKTTLLRRVTLDLTGLPPAPEEVEEFLADNSPAAFERVVDRLLASPRLGERWARHWLDIVRYADTAGFRPDVLRPEAYRYRDFVIRAFNDDLPYDRFVRQQIAGDELEPGNPDALIATGFLRLYPHEGNASDFVKQRQNVLDDVTEVTGLAFLGLTLGCAKCHDHKFDPIEQTDFFRLQACFSAVVPRDDLAPVTPEVLAAFTKQQKTWEEATAEIRRQMDVVSEPVRLGAILEITAAYDAETRAAWLTVEAERTTRQRQLIELSAAYINNIVRKRVARMEGKPGEAYKSLASELAKFEHLKPAALPAAMAVCDGPGPAPETRVLESGDYRKPEEAVSPGVPEFLGAEEQGPDALTVGVRVGGRRAALAKWLTLPDHPLTSRVMVNRLWQHHFGAGIVATSNDFGSMGDEPTSAALLDWLSGEFVQRGWSLKAIHRQMVLSATYRQSSRVNPSNPLHQQALKADPTNKLLWHARRKRLEAEIVHDMLYAVSGRLAGTMYGPSVYPKLPAAVLATSRYAWTPDESEANLNRRSIYAFQMRNLRHPFLAAFDQPDMYISCGVRMNTLTPTQSLALFNGEETATQAAHWAGRLLAESFDDESFTRRAWLEAYSRQPTREELAAAREFLAAQAERIYAGEANVPTASQPLPCPPCLEPHRAAAYVDLCHALLNTSEFLFVD